MLGIQVHGCTCQYKQEKGGAGETPTPLPAGRRRYENRTRVLGRQATVLGSMVFAGEPKEDGDSGEDDDEAADGVAQVLPETVIQKDGRRSDE